MGIQYFSIMGLKCLVCSENHDVDYLHSKEIDKTLRTDFYNQRWTAQHIVMGMSIFMIVKSA